MNETNITESNTFKTVIGIALRIVVFLGAALGVIIRIFTIIPILVGILIIWKDPKLYGRFMGWILVLGGFTATLLYYIAYSIEGGIFY